MGYKRCLEANEYEGLSLNKAKRFECNNERISLADIVTPNNAFGKSSISGKCFFYKYIFLSVLLFSDRVCLGFHLPD